MNHSERSFPNHTLERDIGLAEYSSAAIRLESEESAFSWATHIATLVASGVVYIALKLGVGDVGLDLSPKVLVEVKGVFLLLVLLVSLAAIGRFSYLTKKRVFAARKVIVLRRMLGVSYGENTLVLPNWRVEGADHPFSIHMYPGAFSNQAYPVHMILLTASISIWLLGNSLAQFLANFHDIFHLLNDQKAIWIAIYYFTGCLIFRVSLYDHHENFRLSIAKICAIFFRVRLVPNFEMTMYQVKITIAEAFRIKTDFVSARKFSVFIEDKQFYKHCGVNWRGITRAIHGYYKTRKKSGGSSITQQFARSNFIIRPQSSFCRKIVEIALAKWVNSVLSKEDTLDAYLCTVRFDKGIYGIHNAYRHFFSDNPEKVSPDKAFLLVERLANIRGYFLGNRVSQLLKGAKSEALLNNAQINNLLCTYSNSMDDHWKQKEGEKTPESISLDLIGTCLKSPKK